MSVSRPLSLFVSHISAFTALNAADEAAVLSLPTRTIEVDDGAYLVREGAKPSTCTLLVDGLAYRQKLSDDGSRQIVSIHVPAEILDAQAVFLDTVDHDIRALGDCTVATIPLADVGSLIDDRPVVARALHASVLVEASNLREWILSLGRKTGRSRVAHFLYELAISGVSFGKAKTVARGCGYQRNSARFP